MQITSIQIKNFRSIIDSGCIRLSPDNVTVLVGQNESGKSSILEGIAAALGALEINEGDLRISGELPEVILGVTVSSSIFLNQLDEFSASSNKAIADLLKRNDDFLSIKINWKRDGAINNASLKRVISIEDDLLDADLLRCNEGISDVVGESDSDQDAVHPHITKEQLAQQIYSELPEAVLFNANSGILPNEIDLDENNQPVGEGAQAASNFLKILDLNLKEIVGGDRRFRENLLSRANSRISEDFISFWSQDLGRSGKLALQCDIENYSSESGEKSGKSHLVFWIKDESTQLYPKQRSLGVRWFISFYLQLKASEKSGGRKIFLFDEPGANLHAKAQGDVLNLLNKLSADIGIIYSTHSPHLIEYSKLYRVYAVQRSNEEEGPTKVIDAHQLGTASTDTLSPILTAMGSDFSSQNVIKNKNNVLLEEMSGYYYMKAFWSLLSNSQEAHFIASTGVNKIENLVNMFLGWCLDFIVVVDDDKQGREAYKSIKLNVFGNNGNISDKQLLKLPDCSSIEEAFSQKDFAKLILGDLSLDYECSNSEYLKSVKLSKPITAFNFWLRVSKGEIKFSNFDKVSQEKIRRIVSSITDLLKARN